MVAGHAVGEIDATPLAPSEFVFFVDAVIRARGSLKVVKMTLNVKVSEKMEESARCKWILGN